MSFTNVNRLLSKTAIDTPIITRWLPPLLCGLLFVYYFVVSRISTGYYQHDEVGHLMQILGFWRSPLVYLTDPWSRGGYKLLYAIPTLFGYYAIVTTNILFAVGAAWISYRIARAYELKYAWLAILLTGLQPFVINLAFRCYAEVPAMFFVTLLVYLYLKKRWVWVAVVASYLFTIRAELVVFALLLGGYFVIQKKWIPFLWLGIAPLILNILGFFLNGDPLYVWHIMVQGGVKDTYMRMGFFYFWLMLPEISGMVVIFPFITGYLSILYRAKEKWVALKKYHAVIIVFTVYFLMHCAFTAESFGFGRSGGVGRFMLVILPMVSVIALIGINFLVADENKWYRLVLCSIAFLLLLLLWWRMDKVAPLVYYGYATLNFKMYNIAALATTFIIATTLIFEAEGRALMAGFLALIVSVYTLRSVKPVPIIGEDKNLVTAVSWLYQSKIRTHQVFANHPVAIYEYGKQIHDLWQVNGYDSNTVAHAQPGDVFVLEEHYTDEGIGKQLLSSNDFKVLKKVDSNDTKLPAWVVQRK
jgi:hypothetical protein